MRTLGNNGPSASDIGLGTGDDLQQIERAVPLNAAAGDRYGAAQMSTLDSEAKASNRP